MRQTMIFSGSSCAPEVWFSLSMVLLDCNLVQDPTYKSQVYFPIT